MPIFGDPQNFLKQASGRNNQMSSMTNDNQQTSMNSSTTSEISNTEKANQIGDQSGNNSEITGAMNKDMQTGEGSIQDKSQANAATSFDTSGNQEFVHAGNEDMTTTSSETVQVEEQSGMAKWIQKKVMGGMEQEPQAQEQGDYSTETAPVNNLPEGTNADLQFIEKDQANMPKAPEPPPHRSNVPKGANMKSIPKASMPKAAKTPSTPRMPKMSMPKISRPRF